MASIAINDPNWLQRRKFTATPGGQHGINMALQNQFLQQNLSYSRGQRKGKLMFTTVTVEAVQRNTMLKLETTACVFSSH
jgi:hypothetical protein